MKAHSKFIIIGRKQENICKKEKKASLLNLSYSFLHCAVQIHDCHFRLFLHSMYKYIRTYFVLFNNNRVGASEMVTMETISAISWVLVPNISIPNFTAAVYTALSYILVEMQPL